MSQRPGLNQLFNEQLRALTADLFDRMENKDRALIYRDAVIEKLTLEVATLKRVAKAADAEK
jgi:transposase